MDIELATVKLLLEQAETDQLEALESYSQIKPGFIQSEAKIILDLIIAFYSNNSTIPTLAQLETVTRDSGRANELQAIAALEIPESIDLELLIVALQDTFTQNYTLTKLDTLLDDIALLSSEEVKLEIGQLALELEDMTNSEGHVYTMADIPVFDKEGLLRRAKLGLNTDFDSSTGGVAPTELVLLGGYRGSGKSMVCSNICAAQVSEGNTALYFSIEMRSREVLLRHLAIVADIRHTELKLGKLDSDEMLRLAEARAKMFKGAEALLTSYLKKEIKYSEFENKLVKLPLAASQLVVIDNQLLTLADIDIGIQQQKARHGDNLKMVIVDYVNQIAVKDQYDWKAQIELSKGLKNIAVKHEVSIIAPYQTDAKGEARLSKGLLDAADMAIVLVKGEDVITFDVTKIRGGAPLKTASPVNWNTLTIDGRGCPVPQSETTEEKEPIKEPNPPAQELV